MPGPEAALQSLAAKLAPDPATAIPQLNDAEIALLYDWQNRINTRDPYRLDSILKSLQDTPEWLRPAGWDSNIPAPVKHDNKRAASALRRLENAPPPDPETARRWAAVQTPEDASRLFETKAALPRTYESQLRKRIQRFSPQEQRRYAELMVLPSIPFESRLIALAEKVVREGAALRVARLDDLDLCLLNEFSMDPPDEPDPTMSTRFNSAFGEDGESVQRLIPKTLPALAEATADELQSRGAATGPSRARIDAELSQWAAALGVDGIRRLLMRPPLFGLTTTVWKHIAAQCEQLSESESDELDGFIQEWFWTIAANGRDAMVENCLSYSCYRDLYEQDRRTSPPESGKDGPAAPAATAAQDRRPQETVTTASGAVLAQATLAAVQNSYSQHRAFLEREFHRSLPSAPRVTLSYEDGAAEVLAIGERRLRVSGRMLATMFFAVAKHTLDPEGDEKPTNHDLLTALTEMMQEPERDLEDDDEGTDGLGYLQFDQTLRAGLVFGFSHELGHQILEHAKRDLSVQERELEADRFAVVLAVATYQDLARQQQEAIQQARAGILLGFSPEEVRKKITGFVDTVIGTQAFLLHIGGEFETSGQSIQPNDYPSIEQRHAQALATYERFLADPGTDPKSRSSSSN